MHHAPCAANAPLRQSASCEPCTLCTPGGHYWACVDRCRRCLRSVPRCGVVMWVFYAGVGGLCMGGAGLHRGGRVLRGGGGYGWGRNSRGGDCASDFLCSRGADVVVHTLKQPRPRHLRYHRLAVSRLYLCMLIRPSRAVPRQRFPADLIGSRRTSSMLAGTPDDVVFLRGFTCAGRS